jgi:hypothetical protein
MKIGLNPNRAANPLVWLLVLALLGAIAMSLAHSLIAKPTRDRRPTASSSPTAETAQSLMQRGYKALKGSSNKTGLDTKMAIARNYLDTANIQKEPLIWLRTQYNNTLAELKDLQNSKLEYALGEAERIDTLQSRLLALSMAMNAIAQDSTGKLDKSIALQNLTQEGESFFSLFDSQIIEQRYPMP